MTNHRQSRRGFISATGAGIAGVVGAEWLLGTAAAETMRSNSLPLGSGVGARGSRLAAQDPDLIVFNAKVYTVDSRTPRAEAFAVKDGRFVAVGSTRGHHGARRQGQRSDRCEADDRRPGFIDCHNHATGNVLLYEVLVGNPYVVEFVTIASIVEKLRAKAQRRPPACGSRDSSSTTPRSRTTAC